MNEPRFTMQKGEHANDVFRPGRRPPLEALFNPRQVALIGASGTPGSVGHALMTNLLAWGRPVCPVNDKRASVLGVAAVPRIQEVPGPVDLAVVATPAASVPQIVRDCAARGVAAAIVISSGFAEHGAGGAQLQEEMLREARLGKMRLLGPNCLGVMMPHTRFNATFAGRMALPGNVAFISQSGAFCTAILDWSLRDHVGFSAFVSCGAMADVGWGDLIDHFGNDPLTKSIVCYMESVGEARRFLSAARAVALSKPVIVLKVGHTAAGGRAAASHTGALVGSDAVLDAAFRRAGVLRVETVGELFDMAEVLAKQPRPRGPRLAIVTNAGGPGALATDMLVTSGGELARLSPATLQTLNEALPTHWSHDNPVDVLGDADAARYRVAVETVGKDPACDGVCVILTPQAMTRSTEIAATLAGVPSLHGKPLLASWMGGASVEEGRSLLNAARVPTFDHPDAAARSFALMWRYSDSLRLLYETPELADSALFQPADREGTADLIQGWRAAGRTLLTEPESRQILVAYGIPVIESRIADSEDEAVRHAAALGGPVAVKLRSATLAHKSAVGGVRLHVAGEAAVRESWRAIEKSVQETAGPGHFLGVTVQPMASWSDGCELILGSSVDPQFGPVLLFGAGGRQVEVFRDHALGLPPLTVTLARRMMERTRIYEALKEGGRGGPPVDVLALEQLLVRFSHLVAEQRWISEMDINPLLVSPQGVLALDARVVLHGPQVAPSDLVRLAIRPYPTKYVTPWTLKDGTAVTIRPIRPEDEPLLVRFHHGLLERSVYHRYFGMLSLEQRVAHERLTRMCFIDYEREMAFVVERRDAFGRLPEILGVGRIIKSQDANEAEFALTISDRWQGQGIGSRLLKMLVQAGRDEGLERITAVILPENVEMQHVAKKAGFSLRHTEDGECHAAILL